MYVLRIFFSRLRIIAIDVLLPTCLMLSCSFDKFLIFSLISSSSGVLYPYFSRKYTHTARDMATLPRYHSREWDLCFQSKHSVVTHISVTRLPAAAGVGNLIRKRTNSGKFADKIQHYHDKIPIFSRFALH